MAAKLSTKKDIDKLVGREIFFDANILIYLFWPTAADSEKLEKIYAAAFGQLLKQKNILVADFITISEFINRAFRIEYEKYKSSKKLYSIKFKEYRNTEEGREVLNDIYVKVKEDIFKRFDVATQKFFKHDIEKLLIVDSLDFGDKGILKICKENNYVLLTHDADFKNSDIDILTSNASILITE